MIVGFVDWYSEDGFGVLQSSAPEEGSSISEYFLHWRNLKKGDSVRTGDMVSFIGGYDERKKRPIATKASLFSGKKDEIMAIKSYLGVDTKYATRVVSHTLSIVDSKNSTSFIEVILAWCKTATLADIVNLYSVISSISDKNTAKAKTIDILKNSYLVCDIDNSTDKIEHWQKHIIPMDWLNYSDLQSNISLLSNWDLKKVATEYSQGESLVFNYVFELIKTVDYDNIQSLLSLQDKIELITNNSLKFRKYLKRL